MCYAHSRQLPSDQIEINIIPIFDLLSCGKRKKHSDFPPVGMSEPNSI